MVNSGNNVIVSLKLASHSFGKCCLNVQNGAHRACFHGNLTHSLHLHTSGLKSVKLSRWDCKNKLCHLPLVGSLNIGILRRVDKLNLNKDDCFEFLLFL